MTPHHGKKLKRFLVINEMSAEQLADKIRKAKGTIYNWMKKPELPFEIIELLLSNGIDFLNESVTDKPNSDYTKVQSAETTNHIRELNPELLIINSDSFVDPEMRKLAMYFKVLVDQLYRALEANNFHLQAKDDVIKSKDETIRALRELVEEFKTSATVKKFG